MLLAASTTGDKPLSTKSIWIEIDSLHSDVLLQGISEGLMPNIARIMDRGGATRVDYEVPLQVAAWASAHTGLSVTEHSAIAFDRIIPGTYRMRIDTEPVPSGTAYWHLIGKTGKRVLVINSVNPIMPDSINGIQLTDWSVHVAGRHRKPTSIPPEIAAESRARISRRPLRGGRLRQQQLCRCRTAGECHLDKSCQKVAGLLRANRSRELGPRPYRAR